MAVDITLLFRASVKTVKTRNKALGVAVGGGVDGSRDELFRRSPRPKGDFSSRAREVVSWLLWKRRAGGGDGPWTQIPDAKPQTRPCPISCEGKKRLENSGLKGGPKSCSQAADSCLGKGTASLGRMGTYSERHSRKRTSLLLAGGHGVGVRLERRSELSVRKVQGLLCEIVSSLSLPTRTPGKCLHSPWLPRRSADHGVFACNV